MEQYIPHIGWLGAFTWALRKILDLDRRTTTLETKDERDSEWLKSKINEIADSVKRTEEKLNALDVRLSVLESKE